MVNLSFLLSPWSFEGWNSLYMIVDIVGSTSFLVKKLDRDYRLGNAQVSDKQFDHLENKLRKIDPQNSYLYPKMKLLSLDNYCFSEWWSDKARKEQLIVQPKFDGCALG